MEFWLKPLFPCTYKMQAERIHRGNVLQKKVSYMMFKPVNSPTQVFAWGAEKCDKNSCCGIYTVVARTPLFPYSQRVKLYRWGHLPHPKDAGVLQMNGAEWVSPYTYAKTEVSLWIWWYLPVIPQRIDNLWVALDIKARTKWSMVSNPWMCTKGRGGITIPN